MRKLHLLIAAALVAAGVLGAPVALFIGTQTMAQIPENVKATTLGTIDAPPGYQTIMLIAEVAPNTCGGRLTHPGTESLYILEGEFTLKVDSQADKLLKAGDSFQIPPGVVRAGCTSNGAKGLVVLVVEKGKPLASPAP
jgi:quercetin dioxygenase-like cupin family protein